VGTANPPAKTFTMRIKLNVKMAKAFLKKHKHADLESNVRYLSDDKVVRLTITGFTKPELDTLQEIAGDDDNLGWSIVRKIQAFQTVAKNPGGATITKLEMLAEALKSYLDKATNHWLFEEDNDIFLPYYITSIAYHPRDRRCKSPARVSMHLDYVKRGEKKSRNVTWHRKDLKGGKTLAEILDDAELYVPTQKMLDAYRVSMERYRLLQSKTGLQFIGRGEADLGVSRTRHDEERIDWVRTSMIQEGVPNKLVMDDEHPEADEFGDDDIQLDNTFWKMKGRDTGNDDEDDDDSEEDVSDLKFESVNLPVHPFVKTYNLDRYAFTIIHIDQLVDYKWDTTLSDKLILPKDHKEVIAVLMETAQQEMDDIIKGKSGGTICICTGIPGTGKTLTAEVTSETIQRPLYKVNCSQLGTDEQAIEKELSAVLTRASRWQALLLIDEADVYVRTRQDDIQQNAIVGVFLRVLEYYRGILFLTSNRATVIDDAILSRATVHIKYEKPSEPELQAIWKILSAQFGAKLEDKMIKDLIDTFPHIVGRDVKNLLKLVLRLAKSTKQKVTLQMFKQMAVHKDIEVGRKEAK
jgi:hypothetical protein